MKPTLTILLAITLIFGFAFMGLNTALADDATDNPFGDSPGSSSGDQGPSQGSPSGDQGPTRQVPSGDQIGTRTDTTKLRNPLGETSVKTIISQIVSFITRLAFVVFTIMILIGAWQMITSAGNPEKTKAAKMTILWAAIGFAIILIAQGIAVIVRSFFGG